MPKSPTEEDVRVALFRLREQHGDERGGPTVERVARYLGAPVAAVEKVTAALEKKGGVEKRDGELHPPEVPT